MLKLVAESCAARAGSEWTSAGVMLCHGTLTQLKSTIFFPTPVCQRLVLHRQKDLRVVERMKYFTKICSFQTFSPYTEKIPYTPILSNSPPPPHFVSSS